MIYSAPINRSNVKTRSQILSAISSAEGSVWRTNGRTKQKQYAPATFSKLGCMLPSMCHNHETVTKTYLYKFDPLTPHFYIVKLGFTGYTLFFLFLLKSIDCGYSLEPPRRGGSNEYTQTMFWEEIWKMSDIFLCGKILSTFEQACFRNAQSSRDAGKRRDEKQSMTR